MHRLRKIFKPFSSFFYYPKVIKVICNRIPNPTKMHILQPKHVKMSEKEVNELLAKFNVSKAQLPKIFLTDAALPSNCQIGDVIKIERENSKDKKIHIYYRVII